MYILLILRVKEYAYLNMNLKSLYHIIAVEHPVRLSYAYECYMN